MGEKIRWHFVQIDSLRGIRRLKEIRKKLIKPNEKLRAMEQIVRFCFLRMNRSAAHRMNRSTREELSIFFTEKQDAP